MGHGHEGTHGHFPFEPHGDVARDDDEEPEKRIAGLARDLIAPRRTNCGHADIGDVDRRELGEGRRHRGHLLLRIEVGPDPDRIGTEGLDLATFGAGAAEGIPGVSDRHARSRQFPRRAAFKLDPEVEATEHERADTDENEHGRADEGLAPHRREVEVMLVAKEHAERLHEAPPVVAGSGAASRAFGMPYVLGFRARSISKLARMRIAGPMKK